MTDAITDTWQATLFQFQTGSIKSCLKSSYEVDIVDSCFNSKLVRLKAGKLIKAADNSEGFNSKLVRLKANHIGLREGGGEMFQFQTGSIKRSTAASSPPPMSSFNSKLVRLKDTLIWQYPATGTQVSIPNWFD